MEKVVDRKIIINGYSISGRNTIYKALLLLLIIPIASCVTPIDKLDGPGKFNKLKSSLKFGLDPNKLLSRNRTLLMIAAENREMDKLDLLLKSKANVFLRDFKGRTALYYALKGGDVKKDIIEKLKNSGLDIDNMASTSDRMALLCEGIRRKDNYYLDNKVVLSFQVNVNDKCPGNHVSPFYYSIILDHGIEQLKEIGGDVNDYFSDTDITPLAHAIYNDGKNVTKLLQINANVHVKSMGNQPIWHAYKANDTQIRNVLVLHGASIKSVKKSKWENLACEFIEKNETQKELFIDMVKEWKLGELVCNEEKAIITSILNRNNELLELLLKNGANINSKSFKSKKLPVEIAINDGNETTIDLLSQYGANFKNISPDVLQELYCKKILNEGPLSKTDKKILNNIKNWDIECNGELATIIAINNGKIDYLEYLLKKGADPNSKSIKKQSSAVEFSISKNNWEALKLLYNNNSKDKLSAVSIKEVLSKAPGDIASLALKNRNKNDSTNILCMALSIPKLNSQQVNLLISKSAVNQKCADEEYPIFKSIKLDRYLEPLIKKGAKLNLKNKNGKTPLQVAIANNSYLHVKALIDGGAKTSKLYFEDIESAKKSSEIYKIIEKSGIPKSIKVGIEAKDECKNQTLNTKDSLLNQDFFTMYWKLFQKYDDSSSNTEILRQYKDCLDGFYHQIKSTKNYPYNGKNTNTSWNVLPTINQNFLTIPHLRLIQGLTYLAPLNEEDQDVEQAINYINMAYEALEDQAIDLERGVDNYISKENNKFEEKKAKKRRAHEKELSYLRKSQRRAEERKRDAEGSKTVGTFLAIGGALLLNKYGGDSNKSIQYLSDQLDSTNNAYYKEKEEFREAMERIDRGSSKVRSELRSLENTKLVLRDLPEKIKTPSRQSDGVRLFIPRFSHNNSTGSLFSLKSMGHTQQVIRLVAGNKSSSWNCSAAIIKSGKILTAQHCVMDEKGKLATKFSIRYEYLQAGYEYSTKTSKMERKSLSYKGEWTLKTAKRHYLNDWKNDWAILTPKESLKDLPYWLKHGMHVVNKNEFNTFSKNLNSSKVAVAGYSSHLNQGKYITMDWGCSPIGISNNLLFHNCKGFKGDSGAPVVIANGPSKNKIVGVTSFLRSKNIPIKELKKLIKIDPKNAPDSHGTVTIQHIRNETSNGRYRNFSISTS